MKQTRIGIQEIKQFKTNSLGLGDIINRIINKYNNQFRIDIVIQNTQDINNFLSTINNSNNINISINNGIQSMFNIITWMQSEFWNEQLGLLLIIDNCQLITILISPNAKYIIKRQQMEATQTIQNIQNLIDSIDQQPQFKFNQTSFSIQQSKIQSISNRINLISSQIVEPNYEQLWNGFYKKTLLQRLDQVKKISNIDIELFKDGGLPLQNANLMIENCIGRIALPIGLGLNFLINGMYYTIPMCIEEPSVIAAASSAAKTIAQAGNGFETLCTRPVMMGQIQVLDVSNFSKLECLIDQHKKAIISRGNQACESMVKRGGGVEDVKCRYLGDGQCSIDVFINVCDSMGANIVNTVLEHIAPQVQEISECRIGIKILTNLCEQRKVSVNVALDIDKLAYKSHTGYEVAKMMVEAHKFADLDIYRAVTHNKGILNGIEAVCNATGQDTRAVSASLHGYAAIERYKPLTQYHIKENKLLITMTVPISLGTQGGVIHQNPIYQQVLSILEYPDSQKLSEIIACVGVASNFAALRALVVEGIQKGHMNLHAKNIAISSGVPEHLVEEAVHFMKNKGNFKKETAKQFLQAFNVYEHITQQKGKQRKTLCTFTGHFQLEGSEEPVDLHVVFDCHSPQPIYLNFSVQNEINDKLFGKKGLQWLTQLFNVINLVRLDKEFDSLPKKSVSVKLKLLTVLIDLLTYNMLQSSFEQTAKMILHNDIENITTDDIILRYGLALMTELIHIFEYNVEQNVGDPLLKKELTQELTTIIRGNVRCFELWEQAKSKQYNQEEFWLCRKKRLSCTMMLLCDSINLKDPIEQHLQLIRSLGDIYEIEITIQRDLAKWKDQPIKEPNLYTYWLMMHNIVVEGGNYTLQDQFRTEALSLLEKKRQAIAPQLPDKMKHLSYQATKAVEILYNKARL